MANQTAAARNAPDCCCCSRADNWANKRTRLRSDVTEQTLRNGEVEMRARDEEVRFLKMQLTEEERMRSLMKRSLPNKKAIEEEIVALQIEVSHISWSINPLTPTVAIWVQL